MIVTLLGLTALSAAEGTQTFTGTITDDICGKDGHADMRMAPTDAECTVACIEGHGARCALYDGKHVYTLSGPGIPETFAAQRVRVVGRLDVRTNTIQVDSLAVAKAQ